MNGIESQPCAQVSDLANRNGSPRLWVLPVTLARLTGEFLDLANLLADMDPSDAEDVAQIERLLDGSVAAIQDKAIAIASLIREFDARAAAAEAEGERILAHSRAATSQAKWLKDYLLRNLQMLGVPRIQTPTMLVAVRNVRLRWKFSTRNRSQMHSSVSCSPSTRVWCGPL